jgi:feruloyl esterase
MADQQAFLDYAYVAIVRVSEAAKRIIAQYYGQPIGHSYYVGCSTGGREGMLLSQRYPLYFDGIVSGDPAMRTGFSTLGDRWAQVAFNQVAPKGPDGKPQAAFSEAEKKLIVDELLKQCDAKDGIADGLIFSSKGCEFDPGALACSAGRTGSCLAPEKTAALRKAFAGPKDSRGNQVYPGFPFDTGITTKGAMPGILDSRPGMLPTSTATQQDVDAEAAAAPNPLVDTAYTNLSTFSGSGHGGKLLFYHGMSDAWFSPWDTLEYYLNMAKQNGGLEKVEDWSRIYLVPGMGHCSGGEATLDSFDLLGAVQNWVEKGIAPDFVIAKGRSFPGRSRPLCAYPKFAHYKGQGDPEDASNFECRE